MFSLILGIPILIGCLDLLEVPNFIRIVLDRGVPILMGRVTSTSNPIIVSFDGIVSCIAKGVSHDGSP